MKIDCGRCEMRGKGCQDCVITVLGPRNAAGFAAQVPGHLGEAEVKALGVLAAAGMVPPLRFLAARLDRPAGGAHLAEASFPDTKAS